MSETNQALGTPVDLVLGPLPEPAQEAQSSGYMPGCPIEIAETPDYYTADQMRAFALQERAVERERCLHLARYALSCARNTEWSAAEDALDRIEGPNKELSGGAGVRLKRTVRQFG